MSRSQPDSVARAHCIPGESAVQWQEETCPFLIDLPGTKMTDDAARDQTSRRPQQPFHRFFAMMAIDRDNARI
jgi:hypothetical protein